jgi:hypothetical protein
MTLLPQASRPEILTQSQGLGYSGTLTNTLPDDVATVTTGGGSATVNKNGVTLTPGTTNGDVASLNGPITGTLQTPVGQRLAISVKANFGSFPPTDKVVIGFGRTDDPGQRGTYVDLTSEDINGDLETTSVDSSIWGAGMNAVIVISKNLRKGESEFLISTRDGQQRVTVADNEADSRPARITMKSNGAGDEIRAFAIAENFGVIE